jgi:hypothetical protein
MRYAGSPARSLIHLPQPPLSVRATVGLSDQPDAFL